ncbi:glycosyltransferase [Altererythrobacter sp. Z27]|uniref:glycosyltransferase n=1 Tax=Altererythrobacter sp. Z27 TaxID=3461147 RepID=UPI00404430A7
MIRVVLCTHNGAKFLEAQLASIFAQRVPVDVVHLYDFASTDDTRDLAAALSHKWPQITLEWVNRAPGPALSFFHALSDIARLCGDDDLIFLCDQDDVWLPEKVEVMLKAMADAGTKAEERLLLFHDVMICDEQLVPLRKSHYLGRPFQMPRDLASERLHLANPVIGHTMLLSWPLVRLALETLRPGQYVMHDWALALLAVHFGKIVSVPQQLSLYRQHSSNVLGAGQSRSVAAYVRKAFVMARDIPIQTLAFQDDTREIEGLRSSACSRLHRFGERRVTFEIAKSMLRLGPTFGHRMIALLIMIRTFGARRAEFRNRT